ncbi:formylglycine-generating enzyme family protein [Methylomonas sp. ZR1]|uniref:formylglycine-generating enzyme family protein n=1 Tax=Methylomonas sp. ZR1 TaxID=1797072 RepID=UPI0014931DDB|nr:formylglycine-generating enzyme family protein [Methylomonas sp. ZR1]NOV29044.1 formylglycine-generating enzyme family protein [Methylomonas sp. ZR1]
MNYSNLLSPLVFPCPWASEWGEDTQGLWQTLNYRGVRQVFRWIEPSTFMMGSPDSELGRYDYEVRRTEEVESGYWLADTAVTQALWVEIRTGESPSRHHDNLVYPVHGVSWDDAQAFIAELNQRVPGFNARLPKELEWEYACRAGTDTAFSFGDSIDANLVNFNGNYPYANAPKCEFRGKPVPVKSLPANAWGLYEMHGNVWEWCQDAWREGFSAGSSVDMPLSWDSPNERIARGGSWDADATFARSAYRYHFDKSQRSEFFGFRLLVDG